MKQLRCIIRYKCCFIIPCSYKGLLILLLIGYTYPPLGPLFLIISRSVALELSSALFFTGRGIFSKSIFDSLIFSWILRVLRPPIIGLRFLGYLLITDRVISLYFIFIPSVIINIPITIPCCCLFTSCRSTWLTLYLRNIMSWRRKRWSLAMCYLLQLSLLSPIWMSGER